MTPHHCLINAVYDIDVLVTAIVNDGMSSQIIRSVLSADTKSPNCFIFKLLSTCKMLKFKKISASLEYYYTKKACV